MKLLNAEEETFPRLERDACWVKVTAATVENMTYKMFIYLPISYEQSNETVTPKFHVTCLSEDIQATKLTHL